METPKTTKSFHHQAAQLSWVCPILIFVLLMFSRQIGAQLIIELVSLFLMVLGLTCGIVALFGIPRHGSRGILGSAIAGIVINGLLLFIFATNFMAARARAQQQQGRIQTPPLAAVWLEPTAPPTLLAPLVRWKAVRWSCNFPAVDVV